MQALELLASEHRALGRRLARFARAEGRERERLSLKLRAGFAAHLTLEDLHFYPAVLRPETQACLVEALDRHFELRNALARLGRDGATREWWLGLSARIESCFAFEEGELFPLVVAACDRRALTRVGRKLRALQEGYRRAGGLADARITRAPFDR
jgi:hypothetical protein